MCQKRSAKKFIYFETLEICHVPRTLIVALNTEHFSKERDWKVEAVLQTNTANKLIRPNNLKKKTKREEM